MRSIDTLRKLVRECDVTAHGRFGDVKFNITGFVDEVEREAEEMYVPLPVDKVGVPIRVGDDLDYVYGGDTIRVSVDSMKIVKTSRGQASWFVRVFTKGMYQPVSIDMLDEDFGHCTHHRAHTVEELLCEMYDRLDEPNGEDQGRTAEEIIAEYAKLLAIKEDRDTNDREGR